jgi:hypothetical protein
MIRQTGGCAVGDLLAFVVNHAHFAGANALIHADKTLVDTNLRAPAGRFKMQNYST